MLRGPDKRLLRYPLHTTAEDVLDLCGPGIYRVYALDAVGEQLADEHIARWDLTPCSREHRNAAMDPMLALRSERPSTAMATPSEARELFDINYAHRKGEAKRAAIQRSAAAVPLQARITKDPQLVRQIMAIKSALASDEIETLLSAAATWSDEDQTQFLDMIKPLPVSEAIVFCREVIGTIRAHRAGSESKEVE